MRKAILTILGVLLFPALAVSQAYTVITATDVTVDNGTGTAINPPAGSSLCFLGVNRAGAPITYTPSGGSPVTGAVCQTLTSGGALTGSLQIANPATASPLGLLYTITVVNSPTTYLTIPTVSLSGTIWSYDAYALPGSGSALGIGKPHLACTIGAQWTSTTLPPGQNSAACNSSGAWAFYPTSPYCPAGQAYLVPQSGGQPFCASPTYAGNGAPTGSCVQGSVYQQQDADSFYYCQGGSWQTISGGGGTVSPGTVGAPAAYTASTTVGAGAGSYNSAVVNDNYSGHTGTDNSAVLATLAAAGGNFVFPSSCIQSGTPGGNSGYIGYATTPVIAKSGTQWHGMGFGYGTGAGAQYCPTVFRYTGSTGDGIDFNCGGQCQVAGLFDMNIAGSNGSTGIGINLTGTGTGGGNFMNFDRVSVSGFPQAFVSTDYGNIRFNEFTARGSQQTGSTQFVVDLAPGATNSVHGDISGTCVTAYPDIPTCAGFLRVQSGFGTKIILGDTTYTGTVAWMGNYAASPNYTANGEIDFLNTETAYGQIGVCDSYSTCTFKWQGDETTLYNVGPLFICNQGCRLNLQTSTSVQESTAGFGTPTLGTAGSYAAGTYDFRMEAVNPAVAVGSTTVPMNTGTGACTSVTFPSGTTNSVSLPTAYISNATECVVYGGTSCTGSAMYELGTVACGSPYISTGSETPGVAPPAGNIPLVMLNGASSSVRVTGASPSVGAAYTGPQTDIMLSSGRYIAAYSGDMVITSSLPTPSADFTGMTVAVLCPATGSACTDTYYKGIASWSGSAWTYSFLNITSAHGTGAYTQRSDGTGAAGDCAEYDATGNTTDSGGPCAQTLSSRAPAAMQFLGTGADGSFTATTANVSGIYWYTNYTVPYGVTVTVNNQIGLTIHATGTCTIAGAITNAPSGTGITLTQGGGSGGGGGGGVTAGAQGSGLYYLPVNTYLYSSGGTAGAANEGTGGNGGTGSSVVIRSVISSWLNDGTDTAGATGGTGGSSGGAGGLGAYHVALICGSITGTDGTNVGSINANGAAGSNAPGNATGSGGGGGGGLIVLSSQATVTTWPTLSVTGGSPGSCLSYSPCGVGGSGGNGWTVEFAGW